MDAKLNGEVQGSAGFPVWDLNVDTNLRYQLATQAADQEFSTLAIAIKSS